MAETDNLLHTARVETSVFDDLRVDRVDLIPGTKGSGKTALYRIFVDFLPDLMLQTRKVVLAHGVQRREDTVFLAYKDQFDRLSEEDFVDFWCIYFISLSYEQFLKNADYQPFLVGCNDEMSKFRSAYKRARIPDFDRRSSLKEIIAWTLALVHKLKPKVTWSAPEDVGQFEISFDSDVTKPGLLPGEDDPRMSVYIEALASILESLLEKVDLTLWLMVDRLDELFARRSETERKALRGLLRALRLFRSERIRIKVFLRDDIFEHIVSGEGFTALTHVTARKSDTLRWSEDQILSMIVKRIFANRALSEFFHVNSDLLKSSIEYQRLMFYKVFAGTVYRPPNQSPTLRWLYNHTKDGRGVVTPRDVIDLLTRASQRQRDSFRVDPEGETEVLVLGPALIYGLEELSKAKRVNYLEAEFPHKWPEIRKLIGGGSEYSEVAMRKLFGRTSDSTVEDLVSIGVIYRSTRKGGRTYRIPYLYREGLECTQRFVG